MVKTDVVVALCNEKSAQRHEHCMLAVVRQSQKISSHSRPPSQGVGRPKFNQLEMVTTCTYKPSLVRNED